MPTEQQVLRLHSLVVDSDIINQAGPERVGSERAAGANIQAAGRFCQAGLCISGNFHVIDIKNPVGAIPGKAHTMPLPVCDDCR